VSRASTLRLRAAAALSALALVATGCASDSEAAQQPPPPPPPEQTLKAELDQLAAAWWDHLMQRHPIWATEVGDFRFNDKLEDLSPEARQRYRARAQTLLKGARGVLGDPNLPLLKRQDQLTADVLVRDIAGAEEGEDLGLHEVDVNQMYGLQASFAYFALHQHPMNTAKDALDLAGRYRGLKPYYDQHIANLQQGLAKGRAAPKVVVERVITQLDGLIAETEPAKNVFGTVVGRLPAELDEGARQRLSGELLDGVRTGVIPGFTAYRDFLRDTYLSRARDDVSLSSMPGGPEAYAYLVRQHTTTSLSPDEIHQMGLNELERIEAEMARLAKERGHTGDVRSFLDALRADKSQYASSREALLESFKVALKRADAALPSAFGRLPKLPYRVEPMDAQREKDAPAAYYQPGSAEAGRDGVFVANLYRFEERPLFNSPVLAYHESVPGHHLQIAIGQEVEGLPRFRAEGGVTAYVEGWALYSERLSDELGLYTTLEEKVGFLGFAAWRASRLVVDTGLHHKGWTRQHAIDFLAAHTTLGPIDVENEIDRYIVIPGQALAYMVGCLRILELREQLRGALGERFRLAAFHDALLGTGPLPLELMEQHVTQTLTAPGG
jgi:uncharacterized protein (DUF885 family)